MILATHNTWTYLTPSKWWMRPFGFMARCQECHTSAQWIIGARCFDLRVRFRKDGTPYFCHGLMEYDGNVVTELLALNIYAEHDNCIADVRVIFEDGMFTANVNEQLDHFCNFCKALESQYGLNNLRFFGGWCKYEWRDVIYHFKGEEKTLRERHASVSGNRLRALWPKRYAVNHNAEIIKEEGKEDYLMIDFVDLV